MCEIINLYKMKKLNKIVVIFITAIITFNSCNEKEDSIANYEINTIDYNKLNGDLKKYASSFKVGFNSENSIIESYNKYFNKAPNLNQQLRRVESNNLVTILFPEHYSEGIKIFLLEFYNELGNAYDYQVLNIIDKYQSKLDNSNLLINEKEQINSILSSSKIAIQNIEDIMRNNNNNTGQFARSSGGGFWACMKEEAGKKIGRGMVGGLARGAYVGAVAGAAGGTVIVPGLGTVAGAVAGGVVGGAKGAIVGAVVGAIWASADCLKAIQSTSYFESGTIENFIKGEDVLILDLDGQTNLIYN